MIIKLYLDEDVSVLIKRMLSSRGYDVLTTVEANNLSRPDPAQLAFAAEQNRVIVTHNHGDFEQLAIEYISKARHHSGIIVAVRRRPSEITQRLVVLMQAVTAEEMRDQLRYI